ncbi:hypothetical protein FS837_000777 [Tulasnella sp. UAMH 9824]|nr:hypothetical protein FS837_000777 [Tulasnella sp. UAMH 9824]
MPLVSRLAASSLPVPPVLEDNSPYAEPASDDWGSTADESNFVSNAPAFPTAGDTFDVPEPLQNVALQRSTYPASESGSTLSRDATNVQRLLPTLRSPSRVRHPIQVPPRWKWEAPAPKALADYESNGSQNAYAQDAAFGQFVDFSKGQESQPGVPSVETSSEMDEAAILDRAFVMGFQR